MATDMQEDTPGRVETSATTHGGTDIDGLMQILFQQQLEQGRQAREDWRAIRENWCAIREERRAMNAQMDQLIKRLDRLFYLVVGFGSASLAGLIAILIKLFLDG